MKSEQIQTFPRDLLEKSDSAKKRFFHDYTIAHPTMSSVRKSLLDAIEDAGPDTLIFVFGPAGVGKSTLCISTYSKLTQRIAPQLELEIATELKSFRGLTMLRLAGFVSPEVVSALRDSLSVWPPPSLNDVAKDLGYRSTIPLYRANRDLATRVRLRHLKHSKAAPKHASNRPTPEAIREALENALLEEEPRSVADIAKDLGFFNPSDIVKSQPELCEAITKKRRLKRDADLKHQEKIILSALEEDPVPSLSELRRRLGLKCFNTITDRFPELSGALVQRRKDQRSARIVSIRAALEARLQRPNFLWKDAFEATGMKRSSIEAQFPDLVPLIERKNKESRQRQSVQFSNLAKKNVRLAVQQLVNRGIEPSINLVWDAIPRLPQHGKTMVEGILREIRMEGNEAPSHNSLETAE